MAVGIAPIALALHATPQTEAAAKLWWRTLVGTVGTAMAQAVALHLTLRVFLAPSANLPALGLPGASGATNLLIVMCMLLGVLKIPSLMRRFITKTSPSMSGQILRVVLLQQVTRGMSRSSASRTAATRTTSPSPTTAGGNWPLQPTR